METVPTKEQIQIGRLKKKLEQRDRRIAGLERQISELQSSLAHLAMDIKRMPINVERAVEHALGNVRMLPVGRIWGSEKILEVKMIDPNKTGTVP